MSEIGIILNPSSGFETRAHLAKVGFSLIIGCENLRRE